MNCNTLEMKRIIKIKKGIDLPIEGGLRSGDETPSRVCNPKEVAVIPDDFHGFEPKLEVKESQAVKKGDPLMHDKRDEAMKLVAPCSGTVKSVVRGERRHIERIVIEPDGKDEAKRFDTAAYENAAGDTKTEEAVKLLKESGLWAMMRQRPYDVVPEPDAIPRDIFVTAFDSAPLASDLKFLGTDIQPLEKAVELLGNIGKGNVYIGRKAGSDFPEIAGAVTVDFAGPHPAGNIGTQISSINPVNKGETVFTLTADTLFRIGRLLTEGKIDTTVTVAVVGPEVTVPASVETVMGADIASVTDGLIKTDRDHKRIISGNILTGYTVKPDGFLRFPYRQVTVIREGDDRDEFMGWASLSPKKMSQSRSFTSRIFPFNLFSPKRFAPDARLLGGRRAFIMSEEYDRYTPLDIMPEYLLKAIIGRDIEKMEELGIYEVAPEDFALGEYADTSKIEAQKIVREGLDYLRKELK